MFEINIKKSKIWERLYFFFLSGTVVFLFKNRGIFSYGYNINAEFKLTA